MKNKNLLLILSLFFTSLFVLGQAPEKIDFQAMARDGSGNPLLVQTIGVRISVIQGATTVYTERHTPQTDDYGLFMLHIGDGTPLSGNFSSIDWSLGNHKVKVEVDPNGGYVYLNMGTSVLTSTPYALYGEDDDADPGNEFQTLSVVGNDLTISDGNTITLPGGGSSLWQQNGSDIYYDAGFVGIGTDTPVKEFHLFNGTGSGGGTYLSMIDAIIEADDYSYIEFNGTGFAGITFNAQNQSVNAGLFYSYYNDLVMIKTGNTDNRLVVDETGNVGIATSTPDAKLDVDGDVKLGSSGTVFSEIREFTGTTNATLHYTSTVLPTGYNEDNTRILSLQINYNGDRWVGLGYDNGDANRSVSFIINESTLYIHYPDISQLHSKTYRVLLMKIGTAKDTKTQEVNSQTSKSSEER